MDTFDNGTIQIMDTFDISEDAKLAVKRGIYWLDENHPKWATQIDLETLDMAECQTCVIGQAVGDYTSTITKAGLGVHGSIDNLIWSVEHGFEQPQVLAYRASLEDIAPFNNNYDYNDLDILWTEEVQKRLG